MEIIQPKVWNKFSKFEQYTPVTAIKLELNNIEGNTDEPAFLMHKYINDKL